VPFQHTRGLKLIFVANLISMIGSGMNTAAVFWYVLQVTHSETMLGLLIMLQTIPALVMLPFSGVIIDRHDRRRLVMLLDGVRFLFVLAVAVLALEHRVRVWHATAMYVLVAAGFWMFWPTMNALIQEMSDEDKFVHANTFIMAGIQGGFLIAGAVVGFIYDHIGLGGVLLLDAASYVASLGCYLFVRRGVVAPAALVTSHGSRAEAEPGGRAKVRESAVARFRHEMREGLRYIREHKSIVWMGLCWSLFLSGMMSQGVITAPMSDRVLHAGAEGYGWLNAGWGVGAFVSASFAIKLITGKGAQRATQLAMAVLAVTLFAGPLSRWVWLAVGVWFVAGTARGIAGIALSTEFMEQVPKHLMGRVQNVFYFIGTALQLVISLAIGAVAHRWSLTWAFWIVSALYAAGCAMALAPQPKAETVEIGAATSM
jgi:MFS family permease